MQADELAEDTFSEAELITYLREHPDFFVRNSELLAELNLPHASGKAISLVEHQVSIMRERNMEMRRRMNELLDAARENDGLFAKTRSLTLALLDTASLHDLNEVLATYVLVDFEADFVCCHVRNRDFALDHIQNHNDEYPFNALFSGDSAVCTTLRRQELEQLFPASSHDDSGSVVLLPLALTRHPGVLAIGSRDPKRFSKDMDTLFVTYIADVLSKVLNRL